MAVQESSTVPIGFSTWIYKELDLLEALNRLAQQGVRHVEIWGNNTHLDPRLPHPELQEVKGTLERLQVKASSFHAPFSHFDIEIPLEERNRYWVEQLKKSIEYAQVLDCETVVVHPVYTARRLSPLAQADLQVEVVECSEAMWKELLAFLDDKEITLAVENMRKQTADHFRHPAELRELIQRLGDEHLAICFDSGHALSSDVPIEEGIKAAGELLVTLHINDNLYGDMDLHLVPGRGMIPWAEFSRALRAIGYKGIYLCEVAGGKHPEQAIQETRAALQRLLLQSG
ncbi:MAG: sugar phosphate isomerase/epimerase [Nitrospinota bacterium]|nr:MAG: sugar phosphate isomerase/epimerase [Nitrospinota bacterium]